MLKASLICYTARATGLASILKSAASQQFFEPWELIIVDAFKEERHELVKTLWNILRPEVPLKHLSPLSPLEERPRHCWDIPLFINTAWTNAEGEVLAHIEDHMCFGLDWLKNHVEFTRQHPNLAAI